MEYIKDFLINFPSLKIIKSTSEKTTILGYLEFNLEYNKIVLYKKFLLKFEINSDYPRTLPKVYDIENILLRNFHKNSDGSLCLGTELEIRKAIFNDYSLINWLKKCLNSFVFSSLYYEKFNELIFGESEHGVEGEFNSIKEILELSNFRETKLFIDFILTRKYRRKLFKKNSKIKKYKCPLCHKKFYKCQHYSKLKDLNLYFDSRLFEYLERITSEYNWEENYVRCKK